MKRSICLAIVLMVSTVIIGTKTAWSEKISANPTGISISPAEDLMREHGVMRRVLLVYDKELKDMENNKEPQYEALFKSAGIIRDFIENYHEKLEEDFIFPIFEKQKKFVDITNILRQQHEAGRKLTRLILQLSKERRSGDKSNPDALSNAMRSFTNMYRPHAAREDTVIFPALRNLISGKEYDELGDKFEDRERELFGEDGFERKVKEVADIEKGLGIYKLSDFSSF